MPESENMINEKFLNCLYRNSKTGTQAIDYVMPKVLDSNFKRELKEMLSAFSRLSLTCEDLSRVYELDIDDNNLFQKMKMWLNVNMNTFFDKGNKKIAGLLIIGNTIGVVDLIEKSSLHNNCLKPILEVANELLELERANIKKLERYLLTDQNQTPKQKGIEKQEETKKEKDVVNESTPTNNQNNLNFPSPDEVKPKSKKLQTDINKAHETKSKLSPLKEIDKIKAKTTAKKKEPKNDL